MPAVFISHSHDDRQAAYDLNQLLVEAIDLKSSEVVCSSIPGQGQKYGLQTSEWVRTDLAKSLAVVALITTKSLKSGWVATELGAAWVQGVFVLPLLAPGLEIEQLPEPLRECPAVLLGDSDAHAYMAEALTQIAEHLDLERESTGRSQMALRKFMKRWEPEVPRYRQILKKLMIVTLGLVVAAVIVFLIASKWIDSVHATRRVLTRIADFHDDWPTLDIETYVRRAESEVWLAGAAFDVTLSEHQVAFVERLQQEPEVTLRVLLFDIFDPDVMRRQLEFHQAEGDTPTTLTGDWCTTLSLLEMIGKEAGLEYDLSGADEEQIQLRILNRTLEARVYAFDPNLPRGRTAIVPYFSGVSRKAVVYKPSVGLDYTKVLANVWEEALPYERWLDKQEETRCDRDSKPVAYQEKG